MCSITTHGKKVVRTHPDLQFFLDAKHGPARYESIKRVLFVYAKLNPGVKYVQGMNELIGALFYVLAAQSPTEQENQEFSELFRPEMAEADAFNCFTV
jgi:TBC1 domain family member 13